MSSKCACVHTLKSLTTLTEYNVIFTSENLTVFDGTTLQNMPNFGTGKV